MAKETQKSRIERLEKENEELQKRLNEQREANAFMVNDLADLRASMDTDYKKSSAYIFASRELELAKEKSRVLENHVENLRQQTEDGDRIIAEFESKVDELENVVHKLKDENEQLKVNGNKNPRGAGRKPKFSEEDKDAMRKQKDQGKTIRELAAMYKCSIGVVHKIINENMKEAK